MCNYLKGPEVNHLPHRDSFFNTFANRADPADKSCLIRVYSVCLWKYYINNTFPKRVIVENITPENIIINLGTGEVDNHISRDDISTITFSGNVIFILLYRTKHIFFIFCQFSLLCLPW